MKTADGPQRRRWSSLARAAGCAAVLLVAQTARASDAAHGTGTAHGGHEVGRVDFQVSCAPAVRPEFDRAVALLHHMTYPQARASFERIAADDPGCAMAHWGVAMTLFQPVWPTRPKPADLRRGWDEVRRAESLAPATRREQLFVAAAEAFFLDPESTDYWLRIRRWETAMEKVYSAFPDDSEADAFYALALLATMPADRISRDHADRAAEILLRVYERNPDHPGAMHYLVHANDVPGREAQQLEIVRKYELVAPRNPHALHMPTHIYTRLGDWDGVVRGNLKAAEAALEIPAGDEGQYVWDEFPHALEYLIYAELQRGADENAAAALQRLQTTERLEPSFKTAFHLASTRARYALEREAWEEAAAIEPRRPATLDWDRFTWPEAISEFARGLGAAHLGRREAAGAAVARLGELEAKTRATGEELFARNIGVLRLELTAWVAHFERREAESVAAMREAAELETSTPKHAVTPGPTIPAWEQLGDLLLGQERVAEAAAAYRRSLELYPRRFHGLLGAARAARAAGDDVSARAAFRELLEVADSASSRPAIAEARAFLDAAP